MKIDIPSNKLESFLHASRAKGRYSFSREEAKSQLGVSEKALNQALFRYSVKGKIAKIRSGYYAILPPEYAHRGMLPFDLFLDPMMKYLQRDYYIALFSAAAYYGAAHQQPMTTYVVIRRPALRNINNDRLNLEFYVKKDWDLRDIVRKKSEAGYVCVSSPELTALDLLSYPLSISRVFTILEELVESMSPDKLEETAGRYSQISAIQRLGYLLDCEIGNEPLANALKSVLKDKSLSRVNLMASEKTNEVADVNRSWRIVKNVDIESDL